MERLLATFLDMVMIIIAVEAATNLITKSEFSIRFIKQPIFKLRRFKAFNFMHDILDCGYCTSVWVALVFAVFFITDTFNWLIIILVLHRMSNLLHFFIDWVDEKRTRVLDFNSKGEDYERLREEHDTFMVTRDEEIGGAGSDNSPR